MNELPTFSALKHGVAWKVISNIGRNSRSSFVYPASTGVQASWDRGANETQQLECIVGRRYVVNKDNTGIILKESGKALHDSEIELVNEIQVKNGISAFLTKNNNVLVKKKIVAYGQKATFHLSSKIYWGIASEISDSQSIFSAVLDSDNFFELDLENTSSVTVSLNGNAESGYYFKVESQD